MKRKRMIAFLTASFLVCNEIGCLTDWNEVWAQSNGEEIVSAENALLTEEEERFENQAGVGNESLSDSLDLSNDLEDSTDYAEIITEDPSSEDVNSEVLESPEDPVFGSEQEEEIKLEESNSSEEPESIVVEEFQDIQDTEAAFGDGQTEINLGEEKSETVAEMSSDFVIENGILTEYIGVGKDIIIPNGVTRIANSVFQNNTGITSVSFPESLKEIGGSAFSGCTSLSGTLKLPEGLEKLGSSAFDGCRSLTGELRIPSGVKRIEDYTFSYCTGMESLVLPEGLTAIGDRAFYECSGLEGTLELPESLESIGSSAFNGCRRISGELEIPGKITSINAYTFWNMEKVESLVIGEKVSSIRTYDSYNTAHAFYNWKGVKTITFRGSMPPRASSSNESIFAYMPSLEKIYVPSGTYQAYSKAYGGSLAPGVKLIEEGSGEFLITDGVLVSYTGEAEEVMIPDTVTSIGMGAFQNNQTLKKVEIPGSVTEIGDRAFSGCTGLLEILLPESMIRIGGHAFRDCTGLTRAVLPEGIREIGASAFQGCTVLGEALLPESLEKLGNSAFQSCTGLKKVSFGAGLKEIGESAFRGCTSLGGTLELPEGLEKLGGYAFYECRSLTGELRIPAGVKRIESSTFYYCTGMESLVLPEGLTDIGSEAFYQCMGLGGGTLELPESLERIGSSAFEGCRGITGELEIPGKIKEIPYDAFRSMEKVESLIVGEGVDSIYTYDMSHAFYNWKGVKTITFRGSVPPKPSSSSYSIFEYMPSLEKIYVPENALAAYQSAYGSKLPESVEWSTDTSELPPSNLQADRIYSHTVHLKWKPAENENITGYRIYRDGKAEGNLLGDTKDTSYRDTGLTPGKSYTYYICCIRSDGSQSSFARLTATPKLPEVKRIFTDNALNKIGVTKNTIYAEVADSGNLKSEDGSTTGSFYYINSSGRRILIGETVQYTSSNSGTVGRYRMNWDISDISPDTYQVIFVLKDADGEVAEQQTEIIVDNTRPEQIPGLIAVGDTDKIVLSWGMSAEIDTDRYHIYRKSETDEAFHILAYINNRNTLTYTDASVKSGRKYQYYVTGVNDFGQESIPSEIASASPESDHEKPQITKMYPANGTRVNGKITAGVQAQDNIDVAEVRIYVSTDGESWECIKTGRTDFVSASYDTSKIAQGRLQIKGIATDAQGNESDPLLYTYEIDNAGPEEVQIDAAKCTTTSVTATLAWKDVTDKDISWFRVECLQPDGTWKKSVDVDKTLGINLYGLTPDTDYTYRVIGYDLLGNRGMESESGITVHTKADETAPVITELNPKPGDFLREIPITVRAEDDYGIAQLEYQISLDGEVWTTVETQTFSHISNRVLADYKLSLDSYPEGKIFVRVLAYDFQNNQSDSGKTAPFVQHRIDRTPPAAPRNVKAEGHSGYIEIVWEQGEETDLVGYQLYKKENSGEYQLVADSLQQLNYIDRKVKEGVTFAYYLIAEDKAGNLSEQSGEVKANSLADSEKPEIVSVYPANGSCIGDSFCRMGVLAKDNRELASVKLMWKKQGEEDWRELKTFSETGQWNIRAETELPIKELEHGDVIEIQVQAADAAGNESREVSVQYVVDLVAPKVNQIAAEYQDGTVNVSWESELPEDLIGFRVYRRREGSQKWELCAQLPVVSGEENYEWNDNSLPEEKTTLEYKVEAVDEVGNISSKAAAPVMLLDRSFPKAVLNCEAVMEKGVEYLFDASMSSDNTEIISYEIDFGDGTAPVYTAKAVHKYTETGTYTIVLTVTDEDGNTTELKRMTSVREREQIGTLKVQVTDSNGSTLSGADVYFDLGSDSQMIRTTDGSGTVTITAEVGKHTIGCIKGNNEYLPTKKDVIITANQITSVKMVLVEQPIVEGKFEIHKMTFDEIVAAGIDMSKPENQYLVTVHVKLKYGTQDVSTDIIYNPNTGWSDSKPIIIGTPSGDRVLLPEIIGGIVGNSEESGSDKEEIVSVAYLDIPVGVSALKEFFDVKLTVINNSPKEFSLLDNRISLNVPKGLSIVETSVGSENSAEVTIPKIGGITTKTVQWILRGDEIGKYYLSANYSGVLSEFNRTVKALFESKDPIEVYGLSGMKMSVHVAKQLKNKILYYDADLANIGETEIYFPHLKCPGEMLEAYYYTKGNVEGEEIEPDNLEIMLSGDKMVQHCQIEVEENLEEVNARLLEYFYDVGNTYGLQIEIIQEDLSYFEAARDMVVYKFDSQGGSYVAPIRNIKKGATISVPGAPKKDGKIFGGWFSKREGMGDILTHRTKAEKSMTWYAFWTDEHAGAGTLLSKLKEDEYGFCIIDSEGNPVEGAAVTRTDQIGPLKMMTDPDGDVKFKKFTVGKISIMVEKEGYQTYSDSDYKVSKSGYDIITIYKEGQETHKLTKAKYFSSLAGLPVVAENKGDAEGVNLLRQAKRVASNASVVMRIECETAAGNTGEERLELWQDSKQIAVADSNGVFDGLTPKHFSSGKGIHVRTYYDFLNPKKYSRTSLNLEIVSAPSVKNSLSLGSATKFSVSDNIPFLGGYTLNFGLPELPVIAYSSEDTIRVGVNLKEETLKDEKINEGFGQLVSSLNQASSCGSVGLEKVNAQVKEYCAKNHYIAMEGWELADPKIEMAVVGYFEGKLSRHSGATALNGYLCISISVSNKYGWTIPTVFAVPLTIEVEVGFDGSLSAKGTYNLEESNLSGTLALNLKGAMEVLGAIGSSGVMAAGVTGGASVAIEFYIASTNGNPGLNSVALSGSLGVKAYVGNKKLSKNFVEGTWYIYSRNNERKLKASQFAYMSELYDSENYSFVDREYLEEQSSWLGAEIQEGEIQNLITNTYGGSAPQIVTANGKAVMVFRYDDGSRDTPNMGQLVYSVQKDGIWQEPRPVDSNELADIAFHLYSDGEKIYLTYQEAVEKLTEETAGLSELLKHTQLRETEFDMATESFRESTALTPEEGFVYASDPKYAVIDGKKIAVWIGNTNPDIFRLNGTNQILVRIYENGQWGETKTLLKNSRNIVSMDIGELGGQAAIIYCVDQDNDMNTSKDQELYCMDLEGNSILLGNGETAGIQFVNDPQIGMSGVLWNRNGQICYLEDMQKESVVLTGAETKISSDYVLCGGRIYYLASDINGNKNVFAVQKRGDGSWSSAFQITNQSQQIISMDAAKVNGEDWIVLTQSNMDFEKEVNNLCWVKIGESYDLELVETSFDMKSAAPGAELPVTLTLRNRGSCTVQSIGYSAETEDGTVLTEGTADVGIPAGKTGNADIMVKVPENSAEEPVKIQVWILQDGKKTAEISEENNSAQIVTSLTDLSVSMELYTTAGRNIALINVTNESQVPSGGRLNIYVSNDSEGLISTEYLTELQPGETQSFKLELEKETFENIKNEAELVAEIFADIKDYAPDNNSASEIAEQGISLSYYVAGKLYQKDFYFADEEIVFPENPVGEGTFQGWYSKGKKLEKGARIYESIECYAVFQDKAVWVVDTDGGSHSFETWEEYLSSELLEKTAQLTVSGEVILHTDFVIRENMRLIIGTEGRFHVLEGTTLSNEGVLTNYGTLRVEGNLENTGRIYNENSMLISRNGKLHNHGLMSNSKDLENRGTIVGEKESDFFNSGVLTTENGKITGGLDNTGTILGRDRIEGEITEHEHVYSEDFIVDVKATCTSSGIQSRHCTVDGCGAKIDIIELPILAHEFGEWEIIKEPTETTTGIRQHTCRYCGTVEAERIEFSEEDLWKDIHVFDGGGVYNGEKYSISITGLKESDTVFYSVAGQESYSKENPWFTDVGNYTIYYKIVKESGRSKEGSATVRITPADITDMSIGAVASRYYTGKAVTPLVTVKNGSIVLRNDRDYKISYTNNVKPGTGRITVAGIGNYTGKKTVTFMIVEKYHAYGKWKITRASTVFAAGERQRTCSVCGKVEKQQINKLTPTIKLNTRSIVLKYGTSTTKVKVSGLAAGDKIASWKSSNTRIVTVNSRGKITAKRRTGKAVITVILKSGKKSTISVRVQKSAVRTSKITGISRKLTLKKGEKYILRPILTPVTSQEKIKYSTSNKKVAVVSSRGVITAKGSGRTIITVTSGSKNAKIAVTVPKVRSTKIGGVKAALTVRNGKSYRLRARVYPRNSDEKITYSSSDKKVATVDRTGKIIGKKKGIAIIYVKSGRIRVKCKVTVR